MFEEDFEGLVEAVEAGDGDIEVEFAVSGQGGRRGGDLDGERERVGDGEREAWLEELGEGVVALEEERDGLTEAELCGMGRPRGAARRRMLAAETAALARWWLSEQAADGGKMRAIAGRDFT